LCQVVWKSARTWSSPGQPGSPAELKWAVCLFGQKGACQALGLLFQDSRRRKRFAAPTNRAVPHAVKCLDEQASHRSPQIPMSPYPTPGPCNTSIASEFSGTRCNTSLRLRTNERSPAFMTGRTARRCRQRAPGWREPDQILPPARPTPPDRRSRQWRNESKRRSSSDFRRDAVRRSHR